MRIFKDGYGYWRFGWILALICIGLGVAVFFGCYTIASVDAGYQDRQCTRYGLSTNRTVQFRQFSHWSYDCFVKQENGVWVTKDQIRGIDD